MTPDGEGGGRAGGAPVTRGRGLRPWGKWRFPREVVLHGLYKEGKKMHGGLYYPAKARWVCYEGRWVCYAGIHTPLQRARRDRAGLEAMWASLPRKDNAPHPFPERRMQWK